MQKFQLSPLVLLSLLGLGCAPGSAGQVSPPKKMVWAHAMVAFPLERRDYEAYHPEGYGANYPLDQDRDIQEKRGKSWQQVDVENAMRAGIDGFSVDIFTNPRGANAYLAGAQAATQATEQAFHIAACLDLSIVKGAAEKEKAAVEAVVGYCQNASGFGSAAKMDDRFVIFVYGASQLSPEAWARVRAACDARGAKTWWIGDEGIAGDLSKSPAFPGAQMARYFSVFDGSYLFGGAGQYFDQTVALMKQNRRFFAGGMQPGYFRFGSGYKDAAGLSAYRGEWANHIGARDALNWVHVSTWNDLTENTAIMPGADWLESRSAVTAFQAAKFRGEVLPFSSPRIFLASPKFVGAGQTVRFDATALNSTGQNLRLQLRLVRGVSVTGAANQPVSVSVAAQSLEAAELTIPTPANVAGSWLRARAELWDGARLAASVESAPVGLVDLSAQPDLRQVTYYCTQSNREFAQNPVLKLENGQATLQTPANWDNGRFADILHNGELVRGFYDQAPQTIAFPARRAGKILGGTPWGFTVARVVDQSRNVAYSDPIYTAPPQGEKLGESYNFDQVADGLVFDKSPFGRRFRLDGATLVSDGRGGKAIAFAAPTQPWSKNAPTNLDPYLTPDGPFELSMRVRPRAYGGFFYGDAGGLWVSTTREGFLQYTRLKTGGTWNTLTGKTPLPLEQWSQIRAVWDGQKMQIFLNGKSEGELTATSEFKSGKRALGYNPFSGGARYEGEIDDFQIRSLTLSP